MDFCAYIGRKWFGLWVGNWEWRWVKVLILVRFDDIGCDIRVLEDKLVKCLIFKDFLKFCLSASKLSWCRDELAYVLPEKLVLPNGF